MEKVERAKKNSQGQGTRKKDKEETAKEKGQRKKEQVRKKKRQ